jgi:hypothetical protein
MKKIILRIDESIDDEKAVELALIVVHGGKVSKTNGEDHYCFHTVFHDDSSVTVVKHPSGTETFYIR